MPDSQIQLTSGAAFQLGLQDAFSNPASRQGFNQRSIVEATQYFMTRLTDNYQLLLTLYRDNWIVQRIVESRPQDMLKSWVSFITELPPVEISRLEKVIEDSGLQTQMIHGNMWGALFGGAGARIDIKGHEHILDKPLDLDTVLPGTFQGITIFDRWSGVYPEGTGVNSGLVADAADPDKWTPEFYIFRDAGGGELQRIHHSRIVRFPGRVLPYIEQTTTMMWGASVIESVWEEVRRRDNIANNIVGLTFLANVFVQGIKNWDALAASGGQQYQNTINTLRAQAELRSSFGTQVVDATGTFESKQYNFSGLAEIERNVMLNIAGAARSTVLTLFGRAAAGLNDNADNEQQVYDDSLATDQMVVARPQLNKILPVVYMSVFGKIPPDIKFTFNPIRKPRPVEISRILKEVGGDIGEKWRDNIIPLDVVLMELKAMSLMTGVYTNITNDQIASVKGVYFKDWVVQADILSGIAAGVPMKGNEMIAE